jgi:hypothetical protein
MAMNVDTKTAAELARLAALTDDELHFDLAAEFETEAGYTAFQERFLKKIAARVQQENRDALARGFSIFQSNPAKPAEVVEIAPDGRRFVVRRNTAGQRVRVRELR